MGRRRQAAALPEDAPAGARTTSDHDHDHHDDDTDWTTAPADSDGDGTPDSQDGAPHDASIHPGASDMPDLSFVDSNCDGVDGTADDAVFAAPNGNDANPGTKDKPKRQIQAAVLAAAIGRKSSVYAAGRHVRARGGGNGSWRLRRLRPGQLVASKHQADNHDRLVA